MEDQILKSTNIDQDDLIDRLWALYLESFAGTKEQCVQDQICYSEREFAEAMEDPDYTKFVIIVEGMPVGLCLLTNNLIKASIAYCSPPFYRKKFPNYTNAGRLYYVTAIYVKPEWQAHKMGFKLLKSVINFIDENNAMVAFDYSENKNPNLSGLVKLVGEAMGLAISEEELDTQHYTSLHFDHLGPPD